MSPPNRVTSSRKILIKNGLSAFSIFFKSTGADADVPNATKTAKNK